MTLLERASSLNAPIVSERLLLEPLVGAHADALFDQLLDPRIYTWISLQPPGDKEQLRRSWHARESRLSPSGDEVWLNWALRRKQDGLYLGRCDATVDLAGVATNLGSVIFPACWNQGYASEAVRTVVGHLAANGIHEVRAYVTRGNTASEKVLLRSGFVRMRIVPNNDTIRGVLHDDVEYVCNGSR
ncbi:MAG TPA: GNAT family N-acetyltransferase [Polyangiaceae bacterium]|jgi:RimJ/RimL family protein N-acetyltransferase|nr:GNAT family N-acetyltransferase [Polyangiaceae bacterium]